MIKISEAELLTWLEREEYLELTWDQRLIGLKPTIQKTAEIAKESEKAYLYSTKKIFQPGKLHRNIIFLILVLLFSVIGYALLNNRNLSIVGIFLFMSITMFLLYQTMKVLKKDFTFKIEVSAEGITVNDFFLKWQEILETYFFKRPGGRFVRYHLIIGKHSGVLNRYDLSIFSNIDELAKAIEHYKRLYTSTPPPSPASTSGSRCSP